MVMVMVMVMVSITFASLNHAKHAVHGPQASPTRTPGYLISRAMATSLWPLALAFAFGDLLVPWPLEICLCRGQGPGHGWLWPCPTRRQWLWPWERRSWHQAPGKVPRPQAMAIASGHGSRPWSWLGPQAYGQRNVSMGIGYRVWGVGDWVVDIGYRVLVFGCFGIW